MKKTRKALLLGLCALLLVGASVLGTMAYLTSNDEVVNTFTVGNVGITLDEAKVNWDGTEVVGAPRVKGNGYQLMPGHLYKKDPTIHVGANSEDCYLFVKVDNAISALESTVAGESVAAQMATHGWVAVDQAKYPGVYVLTEDGAPKFVGKNTNHVVFDNFTISKDVIGFGGYEKNEDGTLKAKITVTAYAIQKDGFDGWTGLKIWEDGLGMKKATATN